jgi:molecular chaperone DnaK (HSP70)
MPIITVNLKGKQEEFTPATILALIFAKVKENAEAFLQGKVMHVVLTVPTYFGHF